jgi:hypothetical protein
MIACASVLFSKKSRILDGSLLFLLWNFRLMSDTNRVTGIGMLPLKFTCCRKSEYRAKVPPSGNKRECKYAEIQMRPIYIFAKQKDMEF